MPAQSRIAPGTKNLLHPGTRRTWHLDRQSDHADPQSEFPQRAQVDTGNDKVAPQQIARQVLPSRKGGNDRQMFRLQQGHGPLAGPAMIPVQPVGCNPGPFHRNQNRFARGPQPNPVEPPRPREGPTQLCKRCHSLVSTTSNSRSEAPRAWLRASW